MWCQSSCLQWQMEIIVVELLCGCGVLSAFCNTCEAALDYVIHQYTKFSRSHMII